MKPISPVTTGITTFNCASFIPNSIILSRFAIWPFGFLAFWLSGLFALQINLPYRLLSKQVFHKIVPPQLGKIIPVHTGVSVSLTRKDHQVELLVCPD